MAKGQEIIVSSDPKGVFLEGTISSTPKPGTNMQIVAATAPVSGRFTWQASTKTAGAKQLVALLCGDSLQGKRAIGDATTFTPSAGVGGGTYYPPGDAYVSGTRGFMYAPAAGEDVNVLVGSVAGTADDVAIGDLFGIGTDGKAIANSSYASCPFTALETVTDPTADYMLWAKFNGH